MGREALGRAVVAAALLTAAVLRARAYSPVVGWLFAVSAVAAVVQLAPVPDVVGAISQLTA